MIIELGGNDALRGLPLAMTRDNLAAMARAASAAGAQVLMVGMQMPPNYGRKLRAGASRRCSPSLAKAEGAALVPFLLQGVADVAEAESMFQPDRIHPNAKAHIRSSSPTSGRCCAAAEALTR